MASSLSNLLDNLVEGVQKIKCKDCNYFLDIFLIKHKCLSCNKNYSSKLDEKLKKRFKFSDNDFNKFIFLLRKGFYPCEYMDEWERFNETKLSEKEKFYSNLKIEDIADAYYMHAKSVCKDFKIKHLSEYHDLHLKSNILLLADVFENFRKMCLKICHLDPVKFLSAPRLAWQAA